MPPQPIPESVLCFVRGPDSWEADHVRRAYLGGHVNKTATFGGIQFFRMEDGYLHPGDQLAHWRAPGGLKLFCRIGMRSRLSAHWEAQAPSGERAAGMSADDALEGLRKMGALT